MEIKRDSYLEKLKIRKDNGMIKYHRNKKMWLPQVAQFSLERQKAEYLKNIFTNVYIKDVVERR